MNSQHNPILKWLYNLLDDEELVFLSNQYKVKVVGGTRKKIINRGLFVNDLVGATSKNIRIFKTVKGLIGGEELELSEYTNEQVLKEVLELKLEVNRVLLHLLGSNEQGDQDLASYLFQALMERDCLELLRELVRCKRQANKEIENISSENEKLREDAEITSGQIKELTMKIAACEKAVDQYREGKKDAEAEREQLYHQVRVLEKSRQETVEKYDVLQNEKREAREMITLLELEIQRLRNEIVLYEHKYQDLANETACCTDSEVVEASVEDVGFRLGLVGTLSMAEIIEQYPHIQIIDRNNLDQYDIESFDQVLLPLYLSTAALTAKLAGFVGDKLIKFRSDTELLDYLRQGVSV